MTFSSGSMANSSSRPLTAAIGAPMANAVTSRRCWRLRNGSFCFSVLASRALQGQLGRFLEAARRLGSGDFSSPVPIEGHEEFAALGEEFNSMSQQLAHRVG